METEDVLIGFLLFLMGMLIGMIIFVVIEGDAINELGVAICQETHGDNAEFVSYHNNIVKCEINNLEAYDGIYVKVVNDEQN